MHVEKISSRNGNRVELGHAMTYNAGLESARKCGIVGGSLQIDDKTKKKIRTLFKAGERAKILRRNME
ncbi:hypothetical protein KSI01_30820 [Kurthia sibirica]|uniref:Uncharacterized protein n=1 Tax=Kurthia sibirica TaxID=202750 RepID=A0A2U3AF02_9BACL|nr:hypothetical protein DEX24_16415 [Kurthia sibirica]GEK35549.1 hypothetical protein KSI01_30820 [Kurthia sibirica]